ncbi:hypothetical protein D9757_006529 [Collybiopsis confluens]|uniref:EH domain-containing protein n=1 Tax=Collybiopsis confluens TaxID=2823264 RepID=A0A8H5HQF7_9AGAR|nr:hypothetical protein D9757_006529 [Collybiopsis confluens]
MSSDVSTAAVTSGPGSVLSRVKAFESQTRTDSAASTSSGGSLRSWEDGWDSGKRSRLITDDEEEWVSVSTMAKPSNKTSLAPPLPARKPNHAPASSVGSFHSVSLSTDSIPISNDEARGDQHKEELDADTASLDSYENVDSTTSLGSPGAVVRLTTDWNQKRDIILSTPQRPHSATVTGKSKQPPPPPPPRSASATFPSSSPSISTSNNRRPAPPPPTSNGNRASASTLASSDRSSILSTTSTTNNSSSMTSASAHNGYSTYPTYKPKPSLPNKSPVPIVKPPSLKISSSTSSSTSASIINSSATASAAALSRPTPVPALPRKRYETVFESNLANLKLAASRSTGIPSSSSSSSSRPTLLTPSAALAIPRKGWRGLSIDLITSDELENGCQSAEKEKDAGKIDTGAIGRLPGPMVCVIWNKSQLGKAKLRTIWLESDPSHTGSLDKEAFVKGMWRIDTELRREELDRAARTTRTERTASVRSVASSSQGSLRSRASAGSLRQTSIPSGSSSPMYVVPPVPLIPTDSVGVPPPLPARKPTMGMGLGSGAGKVDLGVDEVDLLL